MKVGSLFAGVGGFELAAMWAGFEPVWSVEVDANACDILRRRFNHKILHGDVREYGAHNLQQVDIIVGGFPCQPFSHAGKREGRSDDRYLWPEMLRIIREIHPMWVIGENVSGIVSMEDGETLEKICTDLEGQGYEVQPMLIPAAACGAWHRRERIWIIAHTEHAGHH